MEMKNGINDVLRDLFLKLCHLDLQGLDISDN